MKKLLFPFLIIASTAVNAVEVVATGYASTYEEALKNAKIDALEKVTGTWINSEYTYDNGKLDETINQYNSGVITKYEVISKNTDSVTIKADVDPYKTNVINGRSANVSEAIRNELISASDKNKQLKSAVDSLNDKNKAMSVSVKKINYINFGDRTQVNMEITISWNTKWISDVEALAKVVNQKTSPSSNIRPAAGAIGVSSAIAMFGAIGAIAGSVLYEPIAGPTPPHDNQYSLCFGTTRRWVPSDCYIVNTPMTNFYTNATRFEIEGLSNKAKILSTNAGVEQTPLFENLYPGQQKRDIIGLKNSFNNQTTIFFKEEIQNLKIQFNAPTEQLAKVDKFNFIFK